MKRNLLPIAFAVLMMTACGGNKTKVAAPVEESTTEEMPVATETIDTAAVRKKAADELKSWGAKDAYFDKDGYLVYEVASTDLSASADEVAREMYEMFGDTPTLEGICVVDYIDKKELGCYPEKTREDE